ncbi:MAG: hypothetical protein QXS41_02705 [Candidatus Woesearchaeota archaeon]
MNFAFFKNKLLKFVEQKKDYLDLNAFEIKKIKKNYFLLYLPEIKESYIIDKYLYSAIIFLAFKRSRNELLNYLKENNLYHYLEFIEKILIKKQSNSARFVKFEFIKKINEKVLFLFFLFQMVIIFLGFSILIKEPFKVNDLYYFKGFTFVFFSYLIWFFTAIVHEIMHLFVGNYFDVDGKIYFSFYFIFPALVTELPRTVMLKKHQRMLIHSIGIFTDLFFMTLFLLLSYFHKEFFRFAAIIKFFSILAQLKIYYKTDLYFLIEDFFDTFNLKEESKMIFNKFLKKEKIRKYDFYNPFLAIYVFLFVLVLGWIVQIYLILTYFVPFLIVMHNHSFESRLMIYSFLLIWFLFNFKKIITVFFLKSSKAKNQDVKEQY